MALRYAIRRLAQERKFTATALVTLALCLGANLAIFAVVDSVLLRPLPFPGADRLVRVFNTYPKAGVIDDGASVANYYERRGRMAAFTSLALYRDGTAIVGETGSTEREFIARVSPDFFSTLGTGPIIGRAFTDEETTPQTAGVAILSDAFWRQRFNADPNVLGQVVRVDGAARRVVGVLPADFRFLSSRARLYFPLASSPEQRIAAARHSGSSTEMTARLAPGATIAEAQSQIDAHNASVAHEFPQAAMIADAGFRTKVVGLHADHVASIRPTLLLLQAGVLLLLAIGGVNLANLLLIRASGHHKDVAIRQSMGASPRHIITDVMVETTVLTVTGGVLGLAVGAGGIRLLSALGADQLPMGAHVAFDGRLAAVGMLGALATGIAIAVPIVWFNLRARVMDVLKSESRGGTIGRTAQRLRHGFIVAQIALAVVLLAGAGLLGLSLKRAMDVSPGFRPDHTLTGHITLPGRSYNTDAARVTFADRLMEAVGRAPGVLSVGGVTNVPLSGNTIKSAITVKGYVLRPGDSVRGHFSYGVAGDYFSALGIPLREGRWLTGDDSHRDERICVVDDDFARRYWPQGGALGQKLFMGAREGPDAEAFTIVGVVAAVKQTAMTDAAAQGTVYFPYRHRDDNSMFVVARTSLSPESLAATVRSAVRAIDPELPVDDLRSMDVRIADSLVARRSPVLLAGIFAAVALLLAAIGTYGVLSYAVQQRRREIGVRMALGALPRQIGAQFLSLGARLLIAGGMLGVAGAWMSGRAMQGLLFEVPAFHAATLIGAVVIMSTVTLIACLLPSRRAARMSPMEVIRCRPGL